MFRARSQKEAPRAAGNRVETYAREHRNLIDRRIETAVSVHEPLVLVSQIQRSGGTLLSQLFDAHPQVHAHPYELKIGFPRKYDWPVLDLTDSPKRWYKLLAEKDIGRHFAEGYTKFSAAALTELAPGDAPDRFPFLLPPRLQREIFLRLAGERAPETTREVIDWYMASYFNAWLDNQNLYNGPKRVVTGFTPRLVMDPASVEGFFASYPDGTMICVVRDPKSWYASARRHQPEEYGEVDRAVDLWLASTQAILAAHDRDPKRVVVITYERLAGDTENVMRDLSLRIGIEYQPILHSPTFNGMPIRADSSFGVMKHGVIADPLSRERHVERDLLIRIEERAGEFYARATSRAA